MGTGDLHTLLVSDVPTPDLSVCGVSTIHETGTGSCDKDRYAEMDEKLLPGDSLLRQEEEPSSYQDWDCE